MSLKVLIVEDEGIVALDLQASLRAQGFETCGPVARGEAVLEAARTHEPDVLLMDVHLAGAVDGLEAAAQVREVLDLPVVFLTAQSDGQTIRRIHELGSHGYLLKPFADHEVGPVLSAAVDQHRAARAERERGDSLWVTLQSISDAVVRVDRAGRVEHLNPAAEQLTGHRHDEARGRALSEVLPITAGRDGPRIDSAARRALDTEVSQVLPNDTWVRDRQGLQRPVSGTLAPIHDEDGALDGLVIVLRDLTSHQRAESLLARADRVASLTTLAATIAHEINNPLTYVVANLEVALERAEVEDSVGELLRDALGGAHDIRGIVNDLQVLARPAEGRLTPVDPRSAIRRALRVLQPEIVLHGHLDAALEHTPKVLGDAVLISQVVDHLVSNAAQALGRDGSGTVRVRLTEEGDEVLLVVEDDGEGIAPEHQARAFEPFFTTRNPSEASGLGLAVVRRAVQDLGGTLHLDSAPGRGTRVEVRLPALDPTTLTDASQPPREAPRSRVLLVDDDRMVRRALGQVLRRHHEVTAVGSVDEALRTVDEQAGFDVVLCDVVMAPRDGLDLYRALSERSDPLAGHFAFLTGGVTTAETQRALDATGRPVATKPLHRPELLELVARMAAPRDGLTG